MCVRITVYTAVHITTQNILIIFSVILQTMILAQMMSTGGLLVNVRKNLPI